MNTIESFEDVSLKSKIEDAFEENLGSNCFEDYRNLQLLESKLIEAMLKNIDHFAAPKINPCVVTYTKSEASYAAMFPNVLMPDDKRLARTADEIMKDILAEEFFYDDYYPNEDYEIPMVSAVEEVPVIEAEPQLQTPVIHEPIIPVQETASFAPLFNESQKAKWKTYILDNTKKLEKKITSFLDFRKIQWNFDFSREFIAQSAYAALCIFVMIPFGIVAAEKMQFPVSELWRTEASVQDTTKRSQNQAPIEVQLEDKTIQLPVIPQPEQDKQQLVAQNLQIVTPAQEGMTISGENSNQIQTEKEEPVYTNTETYEPVYEYAYTEPAWVEPVSEPAPQITNAAVTEPIPETNPVIQEVPNNVEIQKIERPEPVNVTPVEPPVQSTPNRLEPLPMSDAFIKPATETTRIK